MTTISKALDLLDLFTETHPRLGLSDVMRLAKRDKATAHRHLTALLAAQFLEQDSESRAYRLGPALTRLAAMRQRTVPEEARIRNIVETISRSVCELVHVSRLRGFDLVDVCHAEHHNHPVRVSFDPHGLPPVFATSSGKVWLAFQSVDTLDAALADPRTRPAKVPAPDKSVVLQELARIRDAAMATSRDLLLQGVSSCAVPVFDAMGRAVATCSIAYPTVRDDPQNAWRLQQSLAAHAADVSRALGGEAPQEVQAIWAAYSERDAA